jgi:methionyl-tRNA formyltransferase
MPNVVVIGTYDIDPHALNQIDLMRYLNAVGCAPAAVVFRTGGLPRGDLPMFTPFSIDGGGVAVQVSNFTDARAVEAVSRLEPDVLLYAGGRDILRAPLLSVAPLGCLGGHYGRLPEIRGMGTVEWSVIEDRSIVISVQRMTPQVDMGDVLLRARVELKPGDTFTTIRERCYFISKSLLAIAVRGLMHGTLSPAPQRADEGRQFYRLHPALLQIAKVRLGRRLAAYKMMGA